MLTDSSAGFLCDGEPKAALISAWRKGGILTVCVRDGSPGVINVRYQSSKPLEVLCLSGATDYLLLQLTCNYKVTLRYAYTPSLC